MAASGTSLVDDPPPRRMLSRRNALMLAIGVLAGIGAVWVSRSQADPTVTAQVATPQAATANAGFLLSSDVGPSPIIDGDGRLILDGDGNILAFDGTKLAGALVAIGSDVDGTATDRSFVEAAGNRVTITDDAPTFLISDHLAELTEAGALVVVEPGDPSLQPFCTFESLETRACPLLSVDGLLELESNGGAVRHRIPQ